jgi:hypothetical protein
MFWKLSRYPSQMNDPDISFLRILIIGTLVPLQLKVAMIKARIANMQQEVKRPSRGPQSQFKQGKLPCICWLPMLLSFKAPSKWLPGYILYLGKNLRLFQPLVRLRINPLRNFLSLLPTITALLPW